MIKNILFRLFSIVLMVTFLFSCQTEQSELIDEIGEGTITADSPIAGLILNISQNNVAIDDFIDGSNCSSIQFPYQVVVDGQTITINSEADVVALSGTTSLIEIVFPITIVFADYSIMPIASQEELDIVIAQCPDINDSINCAGLVYPITFYSFNSTNELLTTIMINSDAQMFAFFSGLGNNDYVSIEYPILIVYGDGEAYTAANDQQLEDLILNCEEDTSPPNPLAGFGNIITSNEWYVSLFINDGTEETAQMEMYEFNFNSDGTATATNSGSAPQTGTWTATATGPGNSTLKLDLDFGSDDPFDEIAEDWNIINFNNNLIRLEVGNDNKLTFSREQNDTGGGSGGSQIQQLKNILSVGNWFIDDLELDGDNNTSDFNSYTFTFNQSNTIFATNTAGTVQGHWNANNSGGSLKMSVDFSPFPLNKLNNSWKVDHKEANLVEVSKGDDILVLKKE